MALKSFNDNYEDNSTEAGFQFTFFCEICREGYRSSFMESRTHRKAGFFRALGDTVSAVSSILGEGNIGYNVARGTNILSERFHGMSPEWHTEHETCFERAQNEAKSHFQRCPKCTKWICENDWNEQEGLCTDCAPRMNIEVARARAQKMVQDIQEKAQNTTVFHGEIESKQTLCPNCGKPAGEGKFCNNCGTPMSLLKCQRCGATCPAGTRFCGECGNKF
jgi:hypothetical protein